MTTYDDARRIRELEVKLAEADGERDEARVAHRGASARADRAERTLTEARAVALGGDGMTHEQALAAVIGLVASVRDARARAEAAEAKLAEAAKSLEWIANRRASADEGRTAIETLMEIRAYAHSRAGVARAALFAAAPAPPQEDAP